MTSGVEACTVRHEQGSRNTRTTTIGTSARAAKARKELLGRRPTGPHQTSATATTSGGSTETRKFWPSALSWPKRLAESEVPKSVASRFRYVEYWRWK